MDEDDVDEERRLCYVGITRSEKQLYLTHAKVRRVYGRLQMQKHSRFLSEIPTDFLCLKDHSEDSPRKSWERFDSSDERSYFSDSTPNWNWSSNKAKASAPSDDIVFEEFYDDDYKVGNVVEHPDFGRGIIRTRTGIGEATKVQVEFGGFGTRKFLTKFANLKVVQTSR